MSNSFAAISGKTLVNRGRLSKYTDAGAHDPAHCGWLVGAAYFDYAQLHDRQPIFFIRPIRTCA
jgi:hypothetical protein